MHGDWQDAIQFRPETLARSAQRETVEAMAAGCYDGRRASGGRRLAMKGVRHG